MERELQKGLSSPLSVEPNLIELCALVHFE